MPQVCSGLKHSVAKDDYPFFMYEPRKGTPSPSACVHIAPDESCAFTNEAQHSHFNAPCVFMFETQCDTQIVPSVNDVCTKVCLPLQWKNLGKRMIPLPSILFQVLSCLESFRQTHMHL